MKLKLLFCCSCFLLLFFLHCKEDEITDPVLVPDPKSNLAEMPFEQLSDYNFFKGELANLEPTEGVIPYELNTPLFSNYAKKSRFIWMPEGEAANYHDKDVFDFPTGTIIVKSFYYDNDFLDPEQGRNIIETRLLIRKDTGWMAAPYLWEEDQLDARHWIAGIHKEVSWKHNDGLERSTIYSVPNSVECYGCHNIDNKLLPIGPKARNLNRMFPFADGNTNQLEKFAAIGYLKNLPAMADVPAVPLEEDENSGTIDERARAYLDINCGHCHNPRGPAKNSALNLDYFEDDPFSLGICKPPVAAGQGSGGFSYGIVPGQPDSSIMVYRMNSVELDVAMPELARSVIHDEGLELIRNWIAQMEGDCQ